MDNALLSNRNPYQNFTAYNEKQLRFRFLAEKLITPSTSSMRTRISRFTHKKLTNMKLRLERFIALDNILHAYFFFQLSVIKLSVENDRRRITVQQYL
jgi:hypothetical protein